MSDSLILLLSTSGPAKPLDTTSGSWTIRSAEPRLKNTLVDQRQKCTNVMLFLKYKDWWANCLFPTCQDA